MDVQTATVVIAGIGVIIGVINSIISSRRAIQQRQTQLLMQIYSQWKTKSFQQQYGRVRYYYAGPDRLTSYEDWEKLIGIEPGEKAWRTLQQEFVDIYGDVQSLSEFFEGIGVLVKRGLIDVDVVEDLLANRIIWWWEWYQPISKEARALVGDPKLHDHTEYLYNVMKQRQQATVST